MSIKIKNFFIKKFSVKFPIWNLINLTFLGLNILIPLSLVAYNNCILEFLLFLVSSVFLLLLFIIIILYLIIKSLLKNKVKFLLLLIGLPPISINNSDTGTYLAVGTILLYILTYVYINNILSFNLSPINVSNSLILTLNYVNYDSLGNFFSTIYRIILEPIFMGNIVEAIDDGLFYIFNNFEITLDIFSPDLFSHTHILIILPIIISPFINHLIHLLVSERLTLTQINHFLITSDNFNGFQINLEPTSNFIEFNLIIEIILPHTSEVIRFRLVQHDGFYFFEIPTEIITYFID